tara:strand:+ start:142 stop:306 length:165 start_codon:yes stop_codon:yes gene_type:complete
MSWRESYVAGEPTAETAEKLAEAAREEWAAKSIAYQRAEREIIARAERRIRRTG